MGLAVGNALCRLAVVCGICLQFVSCEATDNIGIAVTAAAACWATAAVSRLPTVTASVVFLCCCRHHLGGAQPPDVLVELFNKILQQQPPAGSS
jgi:hypothetical protein